MARTSRRSTVRPSRGCPRCALLRSLAGARAAARRCGSRCEGDRPRVARSCRPLRLPRTSSTRLWLRSWSCPARAPRLFEPRRVVLFGVLPPIVVGSLCAESIAAELDSTGIVRRSNKIAVRAERARQVADGTALDAGEQRRVWRRGFATAATTNEVWPSLRESATGRGSSARTRRDPATMAARALDQLGQRQRLAAMLHVAADARSEVEHEVTARRRHERKAPLGAPCTGCSTRVVPMR